MKHEFEAIDGTKIRRNKIIAYANEGGKIFAYTEPNVSIELTQEDGQELVIAFKEDWQILKAKIYAAHCHDGDSSRSTCDV